MRARVGRDRRSERGRFRGDSGGAEEAGLNLALQPVRRKADQYPSGMACRRDSWGRQEDAPAAGLR
jgi:hypothetical protein